MKALTAFFLFLLLLSDKPDTSKLYITQSLDGNYEIIKFYKNDSLAHILTSKYPGIDYDFYGDQNLKWFRRDFDKVKPKDKYKYILKGDSISFDRSDGKMLIIYSAGTFKSGKITLTTTMSVLNNRGELDVIKTLPNQIFTPY
jgi:hypothetical protein